jgi:DNA anti-recombination protein RmuC
MRKGVFLFSLVLFVLCSPSIFYAQMSSMDKFKMQQQADQIKSNYYQFKNQLQDSSQETMTQSQEIVQQKQVEATKYQEKQEETTEVFDKFSKKSQKSSVGSMINIYGFPILIIAFIGVIFLIVWHKNL